MIYHTYVLHLCKCSGDGARKGVFLHPGLEKIQTEAGRIVTGATKSASARIINIETGWEYLASSGHKHRMIAM